MPQAQTNLSIFSKLSKRSDSYQLPNWSVELVGRARALDCEQLLALFDGMQAASEQLGSICNQPRADAETRHLLDEIRYALHGMCQSMVLLAASRQPPTAPTEYRAWAQIILQYAVWLDFEDYDDIVGAVLKDARRRRKARQAAAKPSRKAA